MPLSRIVRTSVALFAALVVMVGLLGSTSAQDDDLADDGDTATGGEARGGDARAEVTADIAEAVSVF